MTFLYTGVFLQLVYDKWCKVLDTVPERDAKLAEEMQKQQTNEELRLAFAEKANALSDYIQQRQTQLAEQSMRALGTMEVDLLSFFPLSLLFSSLPPAFSSLLPLSLPPPSFLPFFFLLSLFPLSPSLFLFSPPSLPPPSLFPPIFLPPLYLFPPFLHLFHSLEKLLSLL